VVSLGQVEIIGAGPVVRKIVAAANRSARWYDSFDARMDMPVMDFALDYLTRPGRLDLERLRDLSPGFSARYEQWKQGE
jgi:hypothetical protein